MDPEPASQIGPSGVARLDLSADNGGQVMRAASYLQGTIAVDDPKVAPLNADLRGLPPMIIHVATDDSQRHDAEKLATRAGEHGVHTALQVFDDAAHDMLAFGDLPATKRALTHLREFASAISTHP